MAGPGREPKRRFSLGTIVACAFAVGVVNAWFPMLRLRSANANFIVSLGLALLPLAGVGIALVQSRGWKRLLWSTGLLSVTIGSSVVWLLSLNSLEVIQEVSTPNGLVVAYRTNGGATVKSGVLLRQECPLLSGLLRVKELLDEYPAYDAVIERVQPSRLRVKVDDGSGRNVTRIVDVPRLLCFPG